MKKQKEVLVPLFEETFTAETDGLPGGWYVEQNTDMPQVPAIRCGDHCIELLSAGNKFLPIIPDTSDCLVKFTASVNYEASEQFGIILCFRYDTFTGRGQYVRLINPKKTDTLNVEYGTTRLNQFTPLETQSAKLNAALFNQPIDCRMELRGDAMKLTLLGKNFKFTVRNGSGKIALAREHFWDVLKVLAFSIDGNPPKTGGKEQKFTIPLPDSLTYYPIFCDVTLRNYGNCMDASLTFRGGVPETNVGEGNYHGIRADLLTRPYLKVLVERHSEKHVLYGKTIVLVPPGIAPKYLYKIVYEKVDWPFKRNARFMIPDGKFDLAVGFESWHHNASPNQELNPAETVFSTKGKVLYSGLGITDAANCKIEFFSQPDKKIIDKLPKTDPRYERAVKFARENHYFFEKEVPEFRIRLTASENLPALYEVILEDAYLRPVRNLKFKLLEKTLRLGVSSFKTVDLTIEPLKGLPAGVYHIRVRSLDPSVPPQEEYCAFEIMSLKKDSLPPPLISGLPFLYNARTETRGLMTDAFDPWLGASVDEGHYISCAVMLPEAFRKYQMGPTLKAYGRGNFSWISSRTLDHSEVDDNLDIVKESDYVNVWDCNERMNFTWSWSYYGGRFQTMLDFLHTLKKVPFDLTELQKQQKAGKNLPVEVYKWVAAEYWEEWLDYACDYVACLNEKKLKKLRKINPKVQFAQYGPFHIYAARLKGPECPRMLGNSKIPSELHGFWQFEDYPFSCGYPIERGLYTLTSCIMAMPGSRIYPEIYTGGKLKQGCPDGAVFYAHPPFGNSKERSPKLFMRQILNFAFASGYLAKDGFHFWSRQGFQACRFTRPWYEALLQVWPTVLEHPAERPLRSAAYVSSEASRRAKKDVMVVGNTGIIDVRNTASEDVPFIYESAAKAGVCAGFQLFDECIGKLDAEQVDTLVLPPLKGMSKSVLEKIRELHSEGVNLVACEDVTGLEDLFGVRNTGKLKTISKVTPTGDFCRGMSEYCDDERCRGSYVADGAEVLLAAEIPVLTLKRNAKAAAVFFNVAPHMVKEDRLYQRVGYGRTGISPLMEKAAGDIMRMLSQTGIEITTGRLVACKTRDGASLVCVSNPDDENEMVTEITIQKKGDLALDPEVNHDIFLLEEDKKSRTFRVLLPKGDALIMLFRQPTKK